MGWIPDLPDIRDYTYRHQAVLSLLRKLRLPARKKLPDEVDLRSDGDGEYFSPAEDQGPLNCSAAFAVLSLVEYFERRIYGRTFEASRLFLYKVARNHRHKQSCVSGDTGADLRTTLKVLVNFGVPPEEHWPYVISKFDEEPSPFLYRLARPLVGVRYFRLDEPNRDGTATWETVQSFLATGFPIAFGFPVPTSLTSDANIPFRPEFDSLRGGQAALAVGYRQHHFGRNQHALLVRNSWGSQWGAKGYGWLPAAYLRHQLARDYWTIASADWTPSVELSRVTLAR